MTSPAAEIPEPVSRDNPWTERLLLLAIPLLVLVAYLPALRAGFIWDDDDYVTVNLTLRTAEGLRDIWLMPRASPQYYPLVFSTFWVEYHLWGLHPLGYHLVNVLLHAANALLLYAILKKLNVPAAVVIAAVFALHPAHVESAAWVTERKNVLSGLMYLCAALAYLRFWPPEEDRPRRWGMYVGALAFFVLALLSKTVTCTLPAALLIVAWWKRGRITWRDVAAVAPMLLIGLVAGMTTARIETSHVGASGAEWSLSMLGRAVVAARAAVFYVIKDLWPHPLIFFYPRWEIDPATRPAQLLFPAGVAAALLALFLLRHRIGRAPVAAAAIYLVTLFPAMGFFNVYPMRYSYVADHFQYLASIPVIAAIVALLAHLARPRALAISLTLVALGALGALTFRQSRAYANRETLWNDTIAKNPAAWAAWNNLGSELAAKKDFAGAMRCYREALRLKPDHADVHLNIGLLNEAQGNFFEADRSYHEALRLRPNHPGALVNLSTSQGQRGNAVGAEAYARRALEADPDSGPARLNLATAAAAQGRTDEAIAVLREAVRTNPWEISARVALAAHLANAGRRDEALAEARTAARRDPTSPLARDVLSQLERGTR